MKIFPLKPILLLLLLSLAGCTAEKAHRLWPIQLKDTFFANLELAVTKQDTVRGLMYRTSLPEDGGMLFAFSKPAVHKFWMRNTLIPLDIIFIDQNGTITAIHSMPTETPQGKYESDEDYCERLPRYSSQKPVVAAIELNAGMATSLGLKTGDKIDILYKELKKFF